MQLRRHCPSGVDSANTLISDARGFPKRANSAIDAPFRATLSRASDLSVTVLAIIAVDRVLDELGREPCVKSRIVHCTSPVSLSSADSAFSACPGRVMPCFSILYMSALRLMSRYLAVWV